MVERFTFACHADGVHIAFGGPLDIVSARVSDLERYLELSSEEEAQRWLGWAPDMLSTTVPGALAAPLYAREQAVAPTLDYLFVVAIHRASQHVVAGVSAHRADDGSHQVGGSVRREYRGHGYGGQTLRAACDLFHRHFGLKRLTAGCESSNVASRRWLASAGFVLTQGPATHSLPNGRIIDSVWWSKVDRRATRSCRWLTTGMRF